MNKTDFQATISKFNTEAQKNQTRIIYLNEELARVKAKYDELMQLMEKEEAILKYNLDTMMTLSNVARHLAR